MLGRSQRIALLLAISLTGCVSGGGAVRSSPEGPHAPAARRLTVLAVNDVYRIAGVDGGARGGLARVRALRAELEAAEDAVLLLHAGDFLFPSLLSREYKGEQMIDVMNLLDGDPNAFDKKMFVTFGNHEFDASKRKHAARLDRRVEDSQFTWLSGNITFAGDEAGNPLVEAANLRPSALVEVGGVRVGIFGATIDSKKPAYVKGFSDPVETARRTTAELRSRGAELVIGLTHLLLDQDRNLLAALGEAGPDLIIGGHEHDAQQVEVGGRWVLKADADARTATVVRVTLAADGRRRIEHRLVPLGPDKPPPDPHVGARVRDWTARFDRVFCEKRLNLKAGCLDEALGKTQTLLQAEELKIRKFESSLGNWIADLMVREFQDQGAQLAFVNAGSLRLNQDISAGSAITRRHMGELFAYPAPLVLLRINGAMLQGVIDRAIQDWTGNGWWLQVSGFAYRHDPARQTASDLTLLTPTGPRPVLPEEELLVVTTEFLVDPGMGQDGYTMLNPDQVIARGRDLHDLVVQALQASGATGIAPKIEGRVCNTLVGGPCLAVAP